MFRNTLILFIFLFVFSFLLKPSAIWSASSVTDMICMYSPTAESEFGTSLTGDNPICETIVGLYSFLKTSPDRTIEITVKRKIRVRVEVEKKDQQTQKIMKVKEIKLVGDLYLNGAKIGETAETEGYEILAASYSGVVVYSSSRHVVDPDGTLGPSGDFLVEIKDPERADGSKPTLIRIHGGTARNIYEGCAGVGAVYKDKYTGRRYVPDTHPIMIMRKAFYGETHPNSCPAGVSITVTYKALPETEKTRYHEHESVLPNPSGEKPGAPREMIIQ